MGKSDFNERKQARIDRLEELSKKNKDASTNAFKRSSDLVKGIPMGQPILVGHHSEKSHRATLKKSWNQMDKSIEYSEKSKHYAEKAEAAKRNNSISSDDPEAISKLKDKLTKLEQKQKLMKDINRICRSKKLTNEQISEKLKKEHNVSEKNINTLLNPPYSYLKRGFQSFELTNNNAKIKNTKKRIEKLEALENTVPEEIMIGSVKLIVNTDDNRVELYFPEKPNADFLKKLKVSGFRWSRYKGAWQKMISRRNIVDAKMIAKQFE